MQKAFCTVCNVNLDVPSSVDAFFVDAFDGSGKKLSRSWIQKDLSEGAFVPMTLSTTVVGVRIGADDAHPQFGKPATVHLYVMGLENGQSQNYIVGPGNYSPPIQLTSSKQLTGMRLSASLLRSAADAVPTLTYDGGYDGAELTAHSNGSSGSVLVVPLVKVTNVSLPSMVQRGGVAAAGEYVWAYLGGSVERIDGLHGTERLTQLPAADAAPGPLTATADGTLWYAGCQPAPNGGFGTEGIGSVTAAGATQFFASTAMPFFCANLALAQDGAIWFTDGNDLTMMSSAGAFTTVPVKPRRNEKSLLSDIVFAKDGTMWAIASYLGNAGSLVHLDGSGAVLAKYGKNKFIAVATDGRDRIYAFQYDSIDAYDLSGTLQASYAPPTALPGAILYSVQTVTPDGALWFGLGGDGLGYALIGRIASDGSMSEFAVPADQNGISGLAATADGSVWFPGSNTAKLSRIKL